MTAVLAMTSGDMLGIAFILVCLIVLVAWLWDDLKK